MGAYCPLKTIRDAGDSVRFAYDDLQLLNSDCRDPKSISQSNDDILRSEIMQTQEGAGLTALAQATRRDQVRAYSKRVWFRLCRLGYITTFRPLSLITLTPTSANRRVFDADLSPSARIK